MAPVRFAVIGLDHWYSAVPLARQLAGHEDTELVAISDRSLDRAREIAAPLGDVRATDNARELIDDGSIDAIASFVSVDENPAICIAAAAAGKHIISVKPMARTLPEADRIVEAVREAGVVFVPSESRPRGSKPNQQLKQWIAAGKLGRIVSATMVLNGGLPHAWPGADDPGWWIDPARSPGGGWIDHSIYQIDLLRWLLGEEIVAISGRAGNLKYPDLPVEDYGHAIAEFAGGAIATIEDTWTAPAGAHRTSSTITGTEGAVRLDSLTGNIAVAGPIGSFAGWTLGRADAGRTDGLEATLRAIAGGEPLATVADGWANLSSCLAFYRASATGTVVTPDHISR
ncbi:MAG TPA: Gfo/Idh/MocA family oxidoreductase [Mycobacteriales bacterium]|nr:Gfo/Idh/MocA family oxidoreductase [Mycobacteriales bacterium]